jgi:hypothetical protein
MLKSFFYVQYFVPYTLNKRHSPFMMAQADDCYKACLLPPGHFKVTEESTCCYWLALILNTGYTERMQSTYQKILSYYKTHELRFDMGLFVGGFLFDIVTLSEVDNFFGILQQAIYLILLGSIIFGETIRTEDSRRAGPLWFEKIWEFRQAAFHFLLGSLLSLYSLLFLKSASFFSSSVFILVLVAIMIANELSWVRSKGVPLRMSLFVVCLLSFFSICFPLLLGFVGYLPFFLSILATMGFIFGFCRLLAKKGVLPGTLAQMIVWPTLGVCGLFLILYVSGLIPPVPLSVKNLGVYHQIEKKEGQYILSRAKVANWNWRGMLGLQQIEVRPGDRLHFFAQVSSPARFSDQVLIHWYFEDPKRGWQSTDQVSMPVSGGRKEGYRGYSVKQNFQAGSWQVRVETTDGREIGRLYFSVMADNDVSSTREFEVETY